MKLKKCVSCTEYNLTDVCRACGKRAKEAHYKFVKIKDVKDRERLKS